MINIWINKSFKIPIPDGHPISSLQDVIDFEHELFYKPFKEKEITNTYQMTTRNGYDVYVVECIPDSKCLERRYYIPKGDGTTCIIECRTWKKDYDEMIRDICEPAVQSFKFTGEPMPTPAPTPSPDMLDERRQIYEAYAQLLDPNSDYWGEQNKLIVQQIEDTFLEAGSPFAVIKASVYAIAGIGFVNDIEKNMKLLAVTSKSIQNAGIHHGITYSRNYIRPWSDYWIVMDGENRDPSWMFEHIPDEIENGDIEKAVRDINITIEYLKKWEGVFTDTRVGYRYPGSGWFRSDESRNATHSIIKSARLFLEAERELLTGEPADISSDLIPSPTPTPTPNSPGFEAVFVIAMLLVVAYFLRRKAV